jgi:hypothetical protein
MSYGESWMDEKQKHREDLMKRLTPEAIQKLRKVMLEISKKTAEDKTKAVTKKAKNG